MMKKNKNILYQEDSHGRQNLAMTLVEVVVAIAILSIITLAFFPLFSHTAFNVRKAQSVVDAGYVAQSVLEDLYVRSKDSLYPAPPDGTVKSYDEFGKGYWVVRTTSTEDDVVKAVVKIYSDSSEKELESQMEVHLIWK